MVNSVFTIQHSPFNIQHFGFPADPPASATFPTQNPVSFPSVAASLPFKHIAIEGPIGVGKRSLTNLLAKRFRGTRVLEDVESPFIEDFYKDKRGAAFRTELFFLL